MSHATSIEQQSEKALLDPPIFKSNRLLGHLGAIRNEWQKLFMDVQKELGDIVRLRFGPKYVHFVYDPSFIAQILTKNSDHYAKQTRGYKKLSLLLGQGLVTSEGEFWKRQRRIAQPAFHREKIEGFVQTMGDATAALTEEWDQLAEQNSPFDAAQSMMELTLRIAGETLFSTDISQKTSDFGRAISFVLEHFNWLVSAPGPFPEYWPLPRNVRFWREMKVLDQTVWSLIKKRRESKEDHGDLLSMFMQAKDEETGESMSDKQLRDEAFTMLSAGHETTANAITWTLFLLSQHPEIAEKVAQESKEQFGDRVPTAKELKLLTYTEQVFKESMRLYPPVWCLARKSTKDQQLGDYRISKGQFVFFSQYAMHRHPDYWERPDEFDPDRFAPEQFKKMKEHPHWRFIYFPFSRGQRQCIGEQFAMMEGLMILSVLSRKYHFDLEPGAEVIPETSVTLRPKHGLPLRLRHRA